MSVKNTRVLYSGLYRNVLNKDEIINLEPEEFNEEEWAVISTIKKEGKEVHIDELRWKSKINSGELATILLNLEFKGIVNSNPGKKYSLN